MVKQRKYVVKRHFQCVPKRDDYEIVETELPPIKDGEILLKTEWLSVDPYLRAYNGHYAVPYDQFGFQVAVILESKSPRFFKGSRVVTHKGWCDYCIINVSKTSKFDFVTPVFELPDLKGMSISLAIGAIGLPGATAYFGLLELCQPRSGETVVVTAAAGAVGSLVGQIAKIKGCRVIGFAGTDDKVRWLEKELGFNKAFNYKTVNVIQALKEAAPKGVDCYFDNVGGEISSLIVSQMNLFGRVAVCGSISSYNGDPTNQSTATIVQPSLVFKQIKMEGFLVPRWESRFSEAFAELIKWVKSGQLKTREHVTEGFDNVFNAFIGMLAGENIGKAIVKI